MKFSSTTVSAIKFSLITFLILRIATSLILAFFSTQVPPDPPPAPYSPQVVQSLENLGPLSKSFLLPWYRWDTVHYLNIAEFGYVDKQNTVWPPLYPLLIRWTAAIFKPPILAAILVSNLAAILALILLYLVVAEIANERTSRQVLFWLAVFPSSFFLIAAYTESLFLALALGCLLAARRQYWGLAGLLGALASLTRIPGVLLAVPLFLEGIFAFVRWRGPKWKRSLLVLCSIGLIPLALLAYGLFVHNFLQAPWPWNTLASGWYMRVAWPWQGWIGNAEMAAHKPIALPVSSIYYDLVLATWGLILFFKGLPQLPPRLSAYALVLFLPALLKIRDNQTLASLSRYVLPIFPFFITQTTLLNHPLIKALWFTFCVASQALLLYLFYKWIWVA